MKYIACVPLILKSPEGIYELKPGDSFKPNCEATIRPLIERGKVTTLNNIFEERFNELVDLLSNYSLTADEIQSQRPEPYKQIQEAVDEMDSAWLKEDLGAFSKALETIKQLCLKSFQNEKKQDCTNASENGV